MDLETKDLIHEGIATDSFLSLFASSGVAETKDLIHEGIATAEHFPNRLGQYPRNQRPDSRRDCDVDCCFFILFLLCRNQRPDSRRDCDIPFFNLISQHCTSETKDLIHEGIATVVELGSFAHKNDKKPKT